MSDSIFSKIIRGEIPCHRVYQDESVLAFLDINPLSRGHVLVVPKEPAATMADLSDPAAAGLGKALPRICRAVVKATGAASYNLLQNNGADAGQEVMHVHVHVIPRYPEDDTGLRVSWKPRAFDHDAGAELARKIARLL
ncbi:MAG: HIT family protein [Phycisphaerales bacterium]|nr:HIT family protein [Phycisphaerales bacterium]MCB9840890.1 HIT family protein [Phycisphaeraceae bacterium]